MAEPTSDAVERPAHSEHAAHVERQLATAQQITHIGSWEWDLRTNDVSWSDELYRIYGLEPQSCAITLETFLSRLHPDDRERVYGQVQQALVAGGRFSYPERIVRPDGSIRELDTIGEVARDARGVVIGLIGTCRDVTEERKRDETIRLYANIVQNVQIGLTVWRVSDPAKPQAAALVAFNPAAEHMTSVELASSIGRTICDILPEVEGTGLLEVLAQVSREETVRELPTFRFATRAHARTFAAKAFPLPSCCVGLALEDVTEQVRTRSLQVSEQRVLEMIASGLPLEEVLKTLALLIEEQAPPTIASILLLDPSGTHMVHGAAPSLPPDYNRAVDGAAIGPNAGSCGTAAFLRAPVFVTDIATDPRWESYRELALPLGLRACWSTPISSSDGRVRGTFAMYYKEVRSPSPEEIELIARATRLAGIAIQRHDLDEQLRALSAHIEAVREDERTAMAREIHDDLGQGLTALKMDASWVARRIDSRSEGAPALAERLRGMLQLTDEIIDRVRRISAELRPGVLDDLGLAAAIEWQAQDYEQRTGTTHVVFSNVENMRFERSLSTAIFRIFQEALTNVARHAEAKRVEVRFERQHDRLRLSVRDDGRGISPEAISGTTSLGLLGIRERARRLGGVVTVSGEPAQGTELVLEVPLDGAGGGA